MRLDFGIPDDLPDPRRPHEPDRRPREVPFQAPSVLSLQSTPLELRQEVLRERAAENRMPDIPRPTRERVPKHELPEREREISPERSREVERRIGRDRLPPRYLGLQIRPEEMKLLTELGRFRVITVRDLTETVYQDQKGRFAHDLQFLRDKDLVSTDYVNARRDGRLQKVERIEVVTLTRTGLDLVRDSGELSPDQEIYYGLVKRREVEHDSQIYRAYLKEADRIEQLGATDPRVVLDFELKANVQSAIYHERKVDPDRDLEEIRQQVAEQLELPVVDGQIQIPDARIEYELDQGARAAFSDIEVATAAYRPAHLRAKAQAGFRIYASARDRSRLSAQIAGEHNTLDYILDL
jgi:hypothetical protein